MLDEFETQVDPEQPQTVEDPTQEVSDLEKERTELAQERATLEQEREELKAQKREVNKSFTQTRQELAEIKRMLSQQGQINRPPDEGELEIKQLLSSEDPLDRTLGKVMYRLNEINKKVEQVSEVGTKFERFTKEQELQKTYDGWTDKLAKDNGIPSSELRDLLNRFPPQTDDPEEAAAHIADLIQMKKAQINQQKQLDGLKGGKPKGNNGVTPTGSVDEAGITNAQKKLADHKAGKIRLSDGDVFDLMVTTNQKAFVK